MDAETVSGASEADRMRRAPAAVMPELLEGQKRVLSVVLAHPGVTIRGVAKLLGLSHPTSSYHLSGLCRLGLVVRSRDGREVRHFSAHTGATNRHAYLEALRRDPRRRALLEFLDREEVSRMTINEIAKASGLHFGFVKRTLEQLANESFVRLERKRGRYVAHLLERLTPPPGTPAVPEPPAALKPLLAAGAGDGQ